jgi:hypothetical protein
MTKVHNILIHEFDPNADPTYLDDEGDPMIGFYYQFTDEDDQPISELIGPYSYDKAAEKAAMRAYRSNDF